jgi:hypothetical protein
MKRSLVLVLLGCGGSAPAPIANTPKPVAAGALPGACVDPKVDAKSRLVALGIDPEVGDFELHPLEDLDGDSLTDTKVFYGLGIEEHAMLYVKRGSCGYFVGDVRGSFAIQKTRTKGLADLAVSESVNCEGARCGCEPGSSVLRFDGTAYVADPARVKPSRELDCPPP